MKQFNSQSERERERKKNNKTYVEAISSMKKIRNIQK